MDLNEKLLRTVQCSKELLDVADSFEDAEEKNFWRGLIADGIAERLGTKPKCVPAPEQPAPPKRKSNAGRKPVPRYESASIVAFQFDGEDFLPHPHYQGG